MVLLRTKQEPHPGETPTVKHASVTAHAYERCAHPTCSYAAAHVYPMCRRVLPAHYSDNYITLAPGEGICCSIEFRLPDRQASSIILLVDGWNAQPLWTAVLLEA